MTLEEKMEVPETGSADLVSVIIPAFNAAEFIEEALDSVFHQTFKKHEVIVINDGSPDAEQLERVLERHPANLRYIKQENRGAAAARNTGLRAANGEFVAFLDADDSWLPTFLEQQVAFLKDSNADLVYSDAFLFGESLLANRTFMEVEPSRGEITPESLLACRVTVLTSTVLARKQPIIEVGLFDEALRRGHDFDLWLRLAKHGIRFAYQNEILGRHRIVESGLSGNMVSQVQRTLAVLNAIKSRVSLTHDEEAAFQLSMNRALRELALENGKEKLRDKDFAGARRFFKEAQALRASWKLTMVRLGLKIAPEILWRIYNRREMSWKRVITG